MNDALDDQLEKLKTALQLTDTKHDDLLKLYLEDATDFLKLRLSVTGVIPTEMLAIVRGAAVKKFNRLKTKEWLVILKMGNRLHLILLTLTSGKMK